MYTFDKNSKWDLENHIAIPTLDYIKETTGLDLRTSGHAVLASEENKVKGLTLDAKYELFYNKQPHVQNALSYLIYTDKTFNSNWLNYVVSYIYESVMNGEITQKTQRRKEPLNIYHFTYSVYKEIETSDLEW